MQCHRAQEMQHCQQMISGRISCQNRAISSSNLSGETLVIKIHRKGTGVVRVHNLI